MPGAAKRKKKKKKDVIRSPTFCIKNISTAFLLFEYVCKTEKEIKKHTWCDLHLHREDNELVFTGSIGFDPDESCVVVHVSRREAGPHDSLCLERRNFLKIRRFPMLLRPFWDETASRSNLPITSRHLLVGPWEAPGADLHRWSTSLQPGGKDPTHLDMNKSKCCRFLHIDKLPITCRGSLYGLWMFIRGEKLLFTGTRAPMKGRSL